MLIKDYVLGVGITVGSENQILEYINNELEKPKKERVKILIFTPNPEQISHAVSSEDFRSKLNRADIALPDGMGVVIAAKLMGKGINGRITGVDFMKKLVKTVSKKPVSIGFFGGEPGVAEYARDCLKKMASSSVAGIQKAKMEYASHLYDREKMIHSDIDILFVALGSPKQEEWILSHKDEIPASIIMAVGGAFDFISGRVPRAPKLLRSVGLEWLFRLIIQPWRFRRQARLLHFSALILLGALTSGLKKKEK